MGELATHHIAKRSKAQAKRLIFTSLEDLKKISILKSDYFKFFFILNCFTSLKHFKNSKRSRHLVRGTDLKKERDATAAGLAAASSGPGAEVDAHPRIKAIYLAKDVCFKKINDPFE